jgi:hypothetical protein
MFSSPDRQPANDWRLENYEPASMQFFRRALELAADLPDGFGLADVEGIKAYWAFVDMEFASYGYVVELRDGRRAYLQITADDTTPPEHEEDDTTPEHHEGVVIEPLAADAMRPAMHAQNVLIGWNEEVDHLNACLRETPAA